MSVRLTEIEARALAPLSLEWGLAPPCFGPNPLCEDLAARGLIEMARDEALNRWKLRRTELAEALMTSAGEA